jgi:hypothetical protein
VVSNNSSDETEDIRSGYQYREGDWNDRRNETLGLTMMKKGNEMKKRIM